MSPEFENRSWESDRLLRIGRSRQAEVALEDTSVSRLHAEVALCETGWALRDTGSTNGTYLNGTRIGRADRKLRQHDLIQCGNLVLIVQELTEAPANHGEPRGSWQGNLQVQATTQQSWEEAVELLAMDMTRHQRPGQQLLSLLHAGRNITSTASLDELLRQGVRDATLTLNAQRGSILLLDETTGKLAVRASFTARPDHPMPGVLSSTLAQRCLRTGQSLLCGDVTADPELNNAKSVVAGNMNSVICALLRTPQRRLGVLHLDRDLSQDPFTADDLRLVDALAANLSLPIESTRSLQEKQRSLFLDMVTTLAQAVELRDEYTGGHTQRVTDYALLLAEELNLPTAERHTLQVGTPVHDIGKIGIDDAVLRKQGRLTPSEFEYMKTHTVKGATLLQNIADLSFLLPIVRNHHERWDGTGYPDALAGTEIPLLARVVAVADAFDAMTSDRPYRPGMPAERAFAEIKREAGSQFDPACAAAFLRLQPRIEQLLGQQQALIDTSSLELLSEIRQLLPARSA
jgi:HD-GYP domain-containing protein (c-di-GMP phosphodiesterase class II)